MLIVSEIYLFLQQIIDVRVREIAPVYLFEGYRWSSAAAHMNGHDDILVRVGPLLDLIEDWGNFLSGGVVKEDMEKLRLHERTGRPLGDEIFMERLERIVGKILRRQKPGPKKKRSNN